MNFKIILECLQLSLESKIGFLELLDRLHSAGVISYEVDLVKKRIVYFDVYDQSIDLPFGVDDLPSIGEKFDLDDVKQAIKRSQKQEIVYPVFIRDIMKAGICSYTVSLVNRQVSYHASNGQTHMESLA